MQTTISASQIAPQRFLRRVLTADSLFCAVTGVALVVLAQPIASFLNFGAPLAVLGIGLFLLAAAAIIYLTQRETPIRQLGVNLVISANVAWVVASVALVIFDPFTMTGAAKVVVLVQALLTADVAVFEWLGWRRSH